MGCLSYLIMLFYFVLRALRGSAQGINALLAETWEVESSLIWFNTCLLSSWALTAWHELQILLITHFPCSQKRLRGGRVRTLTDTFALMPQALCCTIAHATVYGQQSYTCLKWQMGTLGERWVRWKVKWGEHGVQQIKVLDLFSTYWSWGLQSVLVFCYSRGYHSITIAMAGNKCQQ